MDGFIQALLNELPSHLDLTKLATLRPNDMAEVEELVNEKYSQWQWTMGHTPQFSYTTPFGDTLVVRKGAILTIQLADDSPSGDSFINKPFNKAALKNLLLPELHSTIDQICID